MAVEGTVHIVEVQVLVATALAGKDELFAIGEVGQVVGKNQVHVGVAFLGQDGLGLSGGGVGVE